MKCLPAALLCAATCGSIAHADIVYTLPPQPIVATATGAFDFASRAIDLNGDSVPEFTIFSHNQFLASSAGVSPARDGVRLRPEFDSGLEYLEHLAAGSVIGPLDDYVYTGTLLMHVSSNPPYPPWSYVDGAAFFGFVCDIEGQSVVGWIRAQFTFSSMPFSRSVTVFDYAYQRTPGAPISAGQVPAPGAAAVLALVSFAVGKRSRS